MFTILLFLPIYCQLLQFYNIVSSFEIFMSFANFDRCESENSRFKEVIDTNPERACNVAIFLGELLMNYKVCIKLIAFILTHVRKTRAFSIQ